MKNILMLLFACALLIPATHILAEEEPLNLYDPWIWEPPVSAKQTAAFVIIDNPGNDEGFEVKRGMSAWFERAELYKVVMKDGELQTIEVDHIVIPAEGKLNIEPNSYQIRLIGNKRPIKAGDMVPVTVLLEDGSPLEFKAKVRKGATPPGLESRPGGE